MFEKDKWGEEECSNIALSLEYVLLHSGTRLSGDRIGKWELLLNGTISEKLFQILVGISGKFRTIEKFAFFSQLWWVLLCVNLCKLTRSLLYYVVTFFFYFTLLNSHCGLYAQSLPKYKPSLFRGRRGGKTHFLVSLFSPIHSDDNNALNLSGLRRTTTRLKLFFFFSRGKSFYFVHTHT